MSAATLTGSRNKQTDMNSYAQSHRPPSAGNTHSRTNSTGSRYVPEGYPHQSRPQNPEHSGYPLQMPQQPPVPQAGGPFMPSTPEQYRAPPAAFSGTVPPAQLGPYYQDTRIPTPDGYERPSHSRRRESATSHYSERSRRSSHSHGDDGHRHHEHHEHGHHEHRHHDDGHHHRSSHEKKKHFDDPAENELYLKRKNTPGRSFGGSLFALYDAVKDALKGN